MKKSTKKWIAVLLVGGFFVWFFAFGGMKMLNFSWIIPGQPVSAIRGTVMSAPTPAPVSGATVRVYSDSGLTNLIGVGTTGADGSFNIPVTLMSGDVVYIQASLLDYYPSQPVQVVVPAPDANSAASVGIITVIHQYTTSHVTLTLTHDNGTALPTGANITGASFTGFTVRVTGIHEGDAMGAPYTTTMYGVQGREIVTGVIVRIVVSGGQLYFATTPNYTVNKGAIIEYIFIFPGEANSVTSATDGIFAKHIALSGPQDSSISDIDIYVYSDAANLDRPIALSDIAQGAFGSYTAAANILNIDII